MKIPRLQVGTFPLVLLSLMGLTSACVDGKCNSFLLEGSFFCVPKLFEELHCDGTPDVENSSTDESIILLVNSKIMREKLYSFRYNGKK